ncbi:glutamate-rich protein 6-like isoform X3 [Haliotis rufescens]|uniref:glutamate-rich protein 6-like isoform X3 n=1 Tax=Haliotis rufescens TaxID=6454 RepID=UPI001EAF9A7E|nr:glutamate-rich protein 6-like isoform X3 [Haliotis rufescens]
MEEEESSLSPPNSTERTRDAGEQTKQMERQSPGSGKRKSVEFLDNVEERDVDIGGGEDSPGGGGEDSPGDNREEDGPDNGFATDSESEVDIGVKPDIEDTSSEGSSATLDVPGQGRSLPKIARGFRPEIFDDEAVVESRTSKRSVTFTPKPSDDMLSSRSPAIKETAKRKTYDGREITMVTLDTQTDWQWVEDAVETGLGKHIPSVKPDSRETTSLSKGDLTDAVSADDRMAPTTPFTPYSDEFGIPILDISSDSDSSDEDSNRKDPDDRSFLPSIGPPQILQYIRESELAEIEVEDPDKRKEKEGVDVTDYPLDECGRMYGMFGGKCEFCAQDIKPFPSLERQRQLPPDELYCCEEYREFVQFATSTAMDLEQETSNANKLINIKPHAHFGNKNDRKAAKERAVQSKKKFSFPLGSKKKYSVAHGRMRERELQRRQQEASGLQQSFYSSTGGTGGHGGGIMPSARATQAAAIKANVLPSQGMSYKDGATSNRSSGLLPNEVARQMKTINYQLSSQRCLEEGWTLRPPSPLNKEDEDIDIFMPEPLNPAMMGTGRFRERPLIQKFYEDGKKFLTVFPDGSGNVFYPNGQIAILISCVSLGQYIYVVHDDSPSRTVKAVFEPSGYGSCYHNNGIVRLYFDQLGGIELDVHGGRRRKWTWKDQETHVHAPPFQPICFGLNRYIGIRVMNQDSIALTLTARKRSCRFNVGSRLKLVAPENIPPKEIDEAMLFLDERKAYVESILDKVSNLLKFPKSPKLDKILPPIHLTSKLQRTEKLRQEKTATRLSGRKSARGKGTLPVVTVN